MAQPSHSFRAGQNYFGENYWREFSRRARLLDVSKCSKVQELFKCSCSKLCTAKKHKSKLRQGRLLLPSTTSACLQTCSLPISAISSSALQWHKHSTLQSKLRAANLFWLKPRGLKLQFRSFAETSVMFTYERIRLFIAIIFLRQIDASSARSFYFCNGKLRWRWRVDKRRRLRDVGELSGWQKHVRRDRLEQFQKTSIHHKPPFLSRCAACTLQVNSGIVATLGTKRIPNMVLVEVKASSGRGRNFECMQFRYNAFVYLNFPIFIATGMRPPISA